MADGLVGLPFLGGAQGYTRMADGGYAMNLSGMAWTPNTVPISAGLWIDESDTATDFQDTAAATPVTAAGQLVGRRNDKSGLGRNFLQASASARPEYSLISGIHSDYLDGVDDGYGTGAFVAATLTSDMDFFMAINRASGSSAIIAFQTPGVATHYFAVPTSGDVVAIMSANAGTPSFFVDGVALPANTRAALHTALTVGVWHVLEVRNLDLSTWTSFGIGNWTGAALNGDIGGVILRPAMTNANRALHRTWLGNKVGLSI